MKQARDFPGGTERNWDWFTLRSVIRELELTHIDIEVTKKCNLSCIHCSAQANKKGDSLSEGEIRAILASAERLGLNNVGFTGGEPLHYKTRLRNLLDYCKNTLETRTHVHTNGTLIQSRDLGWLDDLTDELTVTLFGASPSTHDAITAVEGSFAATVAGLRILAGHHHNVRIFTVPMKLNFRDIPKIAEMVHGIGYSSIRILSLSPTGNAVTRYAELSLDRTDKDWLSRALADSAVQSGVDISAGFCTRLSFPNLRKLPGHDSCLAGENRVHIDAFGEVYPCTASSGWPSLSVGNVRDHDYDVSGIWRDSPFLQFLRYLHRNPHQRCQTCSNYEDCMGGCRVVEYYMQGDVTATRQNCILQE